jgi:hypothetical protein
MKRRPNPKAVRDRPRLARKHGARVSGGADRRLGIIEHRNHPITGVLENSATSSDDRAVHDLVMARQRCWHHRFMRLPERGRPDHVSHQKHSWHARPLSLETSTLPGDIVPPRGHQGDMQPCKRSHRQALTPES